MKDSERKAARIAARKAELKKIAPLLRSMRWSRIRAGLARVSDIDSFMDRYEMYAPLLLPHRAILLQARDSGLYDSFELYASAEAIVVKGMAGDESAVTILVVKGNYWDNDISDGRQILTPW
jgi:hypothetical protein